MVTRDIPTAPVGRVREDPRQLPPIVVGAPRLLHKIRILMSMRDYAWISPCVRYTSTVEYTLRRRSPLDQLTTELQI